MTTRITEADLTNLCDTINRVVNHDTTRYTFSDDGRYMTKPGYYVLMGAYGGWQLQQYVNEAGGITTITSGYVPKRELYYQMRAFLSGLSVNK